MNLLEEVGHAIEEEVARDADARVPGAEVARQEAAGDTFAGPFELLEDGWPLEDVDEVAG